MSDKEMLDLRDNLEYDSDTPPDYAPRRCDTCGEYMTQDEYEDYENQCEVCINEETGGLIADDVYKPLDFSD